MARLDFKKTVVVSVLAEYSATFSPKPKFCRNPYFWPKFAETETEYSVGHYLKHLIYTTQTHTRRKAMLTPIHDYNLYIGNSNEIFQHQKSFFPVK